jgi:hypothetical protein
VVAQVLRVRVGKVVGVAEDVLRARRVELLDERGRPSVVLEGRRRDGRAGLVVSSVEEGVRNPFSELGIEGEGASVYIAIWEGRVHLKLTNSNGDQAIMAP